MLDSRSLAGQIAKPGVGDPRQSGDVPPFQRAERRPAPSEHQRDSRGGQGCPCDIVGTARLAVVEHLGSLDERRQPRWLGRRTIGGPQLAGLEIDHRGPRCADRAASVHGERIEQLLWGAGTHQNRCSLERVESRIVHRPGDRLHELDIDTVDLTDLVNQEPDEIVGRQLHHQLVDRSAGAPLEDLDPDDAAPHRSDAAGHRPERPGAVRKPQTYDIGLHGDDGTTRP